MTHAITSAFGPAANDGTQRPLRAVLTGTSDPTDQDTHARPVHWPTRRDATAPRTAQAIELARLEDAQLAARRAQTHADLAMHRFDEGLRKLMTTLVDAREQVVQQAVEHAFGLAEELLRHEVGTRPEVLRDAIGAALEDLGPGTSPSIRLAPSDAARLREQSIEGCTIVDDPRLQVGDFVVENVDACIDARIAPRIAAVRAALMEVA